MPRGAFILLEGVDRCGKTTQAKKLVEYLSQSGKAELLRFPDRTTSIGQMINSYLTSATDLDDKAIHLLFSANRWEAVSKMRELMASGTTLVVDRYSYSGVAFSASKEGMDVDWCMAPEVGLPAPDGVIFLDLTVEKSMARGAFGDERYEKEGMQRVVRENFFALMGGQAAGQSPWHVLDADKTIEELHAEVRELGETIRTAARDAPVGTLAWEPGLGAGAGAAAAPPAPAS
jgi:dTMP kinase